MIIDIKKFTEDEYKDELAKYYEKPNPPQIEVDLKALQKRIVVDQDYSCFNEFKNNIFIYTKSLLLKKIKENNRRNLARQHNTHSKKELAKIKSEFIDESVVTELASKATDSFVRRYFRLDNPIVGASFAGILDFKCREVLNPYHKNKKLETPLSLDTVLGDDSKNTLEYLLSYELWENENSSESDLRHIVKDRCIKSIEKECDMLDQLEEDVDLSSKFLEYLLYLLILQKSKESNKITKLSNCALSCADISDRHIISIMESAYLDLMD